MDNPETKITAGPASASGSRREILIGGICLLTAATAFARLPRHHIANLGSGKLEDLIPNRFAGWEFASASGLVLPPQDQLRDQVYSQLLTRTYTMQGGLEIMLLVAYNAGQDGVVQIHRPEVCYPASGFQLTENKEHSTRLSPIRSVPSRCIVAENSIRKEKIIYWTRVGKYFPRKWSEQRLAVFEQNLQGSIPDGLLIRISSINENIATVDLDNFAANLYKNVGKTMQTVLGGEG